MLHRDTPPTHRTAGAATLTMLLVLAGPVPASAPPLAAAPGPALQEARDAGPAEPPLEVARVDGVELHYLERGQGEPLVFVHGTLGDYSYWLPHLDTFAGRYRTIAYSRRHNHPNDNGEPGPDYSARVDARDLAGLIETLELGPVHLVGLSYGALTSLLLTLERPELVQTLVLTEPPVDPRPLGLSEIPDLSTSPPPWLQGFSRYTERVLAGEVREAIRLFIDDVQGEPGFAAGLPDPVWSRLLRNATDFRGMITSTEPLPAIRPAELRALRTPTLLIVGQHNLDRPFEHQNDRLVQLIPGAEAVTIPNAGHLSWTEQPRLTRQAVLTFLDRWDR